MEMAKDTNQVEGYVDLQVNGYQGIDFNRPGISVDQIRTAAQAMQAQGVKIALATLITASIEDMLACITCLRAAMENDPVSAEVLAGIHLEGPFLSPKPGFIGAHPVEHALKSDPRQLERLLDAGGSWVKLVTLAPEVDLDGQMTRLAKDRGVLVSAGHTDASMDDLDRCIDAGLTLFTHVGNACPMEMHRHENILMRALRCCDRLRYTVIADGFHIPKTLFENLLRWIPEDRLAVVSDAISAAGLGPGIYRLAGREVQIGPDKAARDPSGKHFVGSACSMRDADHWLTQTLGLDFATRRRLLVSNPSNWLRDS